MVDWNDLLELIQKMTPEERMQDVYIITQDQYIPISQIVPESNGVVLKASWT